MKKEEFLKKLRKNLSVLEEREVQDIVEEYEQHIDMKMGEGLSEEAAIQDFGDLKELTAGILEAYHVKTDYQAEKKNLDFDKVKEESKKATEKATDVLGKGAGALGRGAGTVGKWGIRQMKKLWSFFKWPFIQLKKKFHTSRQKAQGKGFLGRLWLLFLGLCKLVWRCTVWCVCLFWNLCWLFMGAVSGITTLGCIFLLGALIVLLVTGYPVIGMIMVMFGSGLVSSAVMLFCFSMLKRKANRKDKEDATKDSDTKDSHMEDKEEEADWEYPQDNESGAKQITVNSYQEVLNNA